MTEMTKFSFFKDNSEYVLYNFFPIDDARLDKVHQLAKDDSVGQVRVQVSDLRFHSQ